MMHMTFYWGRRVTLFFSSWQTDSWLGYALTLLACLLAAAFYQFLEDRRLKLIRYAVAAKKVSPGAPVEAPLLHKTAVAGGDKWWSPVKVFGALLFGINASLGYMLMLAVMSFNGGVFLAIVFGLTIGYLAFRSPDDQETVVIVDNPCACA
ncbi:copper transporter 5.1 [Carica papaya]|uniref:copper transporter 5.1 n=1 Tax=Carica papaya TaxID=3649 RepID=UPI000B8D0839|nr:copper transporter 5.1 [Carica papaya]